MDGAKVVHGAPARRSPSPDGHVQPVRENPMAAGTSVRNVALVGPNGTGKTTLRESLLFVTGRINRKGKAGDGNTVGDASTEARERQMSTEVNVATTSHNGTALTILDCPGSVEFAQEA